VPSFTHYGNIKGVAKCRKWGGLELPKVIENSAIPYSAYEFLLASIASMSISNPYLAPFLRYGEILVVSRRFEPTLPLFGAPIGVIWLEKFSEIFGESMGYRMALLV